MPDKLPRHCDRTFRCPVIIIAALRNGPPPTHKNVSGYIGDIKNDDLEEIERTGEEIGDKPLDEVRREALGLRPIGPGQVIKLGLQKVTRESQRQKGRVRRLEDYKCQVCGFSIEYVSASGKKKRYIEIDHILDKADRKRNDSINGRCKMRLTSSTKSTSPIVT